MCASSASVPGRTAVAIANRILTFEILRDPRPSNRRLLLQTFRPLHELTVVEGDRGVEAALGAARVVLAGARAVPAVGADGVVGRIAVDGEGVRPAIFLRGVSDVDRLEDRGQRRLSQN